MTESQLQDKIRLALGRIPGLCLWRNNCGVAEIKGYKVRFGVASPGGADLIGIYKGRFVALEIKTETGRQTPEQKQFEQLVTKLGGVYRIVRSVEQALAWASEMEAANG